jgi:hypothetical protein
VSVAKLAKKLISKIDGLDGVRRQELSQGSATVVNTTCGWFNDGTVAPRSTRQTTAACVLLAALFERDTLLLALSVLVSSQMTCATFYKREADTAKPERRDWRPLALRLQVALVVVSTTEVVRAHIPYRGDWSTVHGISR